jgi:hypothetical protein
VSLKDTIYYRKFSGNFARHPSIGKAGILGRRWRNLACDYLPMELIERSRAVAEISPLAEAAELLDGSRVGFLSNYV